MDPTRRKLLQAIGGITATAGLAGCITSSDDEDGNGNGGNGSGGNGNGNGENGDMENGNGDGANGNSENGSSSMTGEARVWTQFSEAEENVMDDFISQFEDQTGHTVEREGVSDLSNQLETAMPAGDGPDTWVWAHDWVGRFAIRDDPSFLYDASDDLSVDLETFSGAARGAVQYQGGVYGLPMSAETVTLFYNKNMVEEPPETIDEMVDVMEEYHNPANGEYGLSYPATDPYFASGFLQAYGGNLYDEETNEVTIDEPEVVQGMQTLEETLFNYIPEDPSYESQAVVFADGVAPFAINGPWELGNFSDEIDEIGVAELPTVDGNHPRTYSGIQMWYFSAELADADEATRQAAMDWAEWYTTTEEVALTQADELGAIPVHQEHAESDELSDEVQAFSRQIDHGTAMPTHPDMDSVWGPAADALTRVFNGDQDAEAALDQAASDIRDAL